MSAKRTQVLLIISALVLFVLLFIAPKIVLPGSGNATGKQEQAVVSANADLATYLSLALKNIEPAKKRDIDKLIALQKYDSLVGFWDKLKRPDLASHYTEELAKNKATSEAWFKAGNRYYYAIQFSKDQTEIPVLYQCAMRCFKKGLVLEPANTDAKIMLATCYVEGTQDPMEGISRLREVEKKDSNNVKLQLAFAFFSVKSGQYDKAIIRFNKVLKIDSTYIAAYLHLADAYEQQGNIEKTIEVLEKYSVRTNDVTAKIEIDKYIKQLKNK